MAHNGMGTGAGMTTTAPSNQSKLVAMASGGSETTGNTTTQDTQPAIDYTIYQNLDNYTITGDNFSYASLLQGLFITDLSDYNQIMGLFGEKNSGTELKFDITDLGKDANEYDILATYDSIGKKIILDNSLFKIETFDSTVDYDNNGTVDSNDQTAFIRNNDYNYDGKVDDNDKNLRIEDITRQAIIGATGLTGNSLDAVQSTLGFYNNEDPTDNTMNLTNATTDKFDEDVKHSGMTESIGMGGMGDMSHSHGDYTEELFGIVEGIDADLGLDVKKTIKDQYEAGHDDMIKAGGAEKREARIKMDDAVKKAAEIIMQAISVKIASITDPNDPFLGKVAKWIQIGLHSQDQNSHKTGTHSIDKKGGKSALAFQLAHFMNAGNDTIIGQKLRESTQGAVNTENLTGASLYQFIQDNGGNFFDLFRSTGTTKTGKDAQGEAGDFSSYWGASGEARAGVLTVGGKALGAYQNSNGGYKYSQEWQ